MPTSADPNDPTEYINGYAVIAFWQDANSNERVILAQTTRGNGEYVVATTDKRDPAPREWHAGEYFPAPAVWAMTESAFHEASDAFMKRVTRLLVRATL